MTPSVNQAVILAGGFGTRLGHLTQNVPKPLLLVAGVPFVDYVVRWLARYGIEEIILSTGYLSHSFDTFLAGRTWRNSYGEPLRVRTIVENKPAGTGGALALMRKELQHRFLLINGDSFFNCNLSALLAQADALPPGGAALTVRAVSDAERYGRIEVTGDLITAFAEKSGSGPGLINAGVSLIDLTAIERFNDIPCSIEKEIYPRLCAEGRLKAVQQSGYFVDIGIPETYSLAQDELPRAVRRPAVFLDRDGVLNEDRGYVHQPKDFTWIPGAIDAVRMAIEAGYLIIVLTNQAGVARGLYGEDAINKLHHFINSTLVSRSACINAFYYCPYHPEAVVPEFRRAHEDRKPSPGMLTRAAADYPIDMSHSFLIGDQDSDMAAAAAAGIAGHKFTGGNLAELMQRLILVN